MADFARGERLRDLRGHESQETVAADIGVSVKTLRAWEHGGKIRWENAKRLGAYYGVDPESLVSRDEITSDKPAPQPQTQLDRIETMLIDLHVLHFGAEGEPLEDGIAARLLPKGASLLPASGVRRQIRRAGQQPPSA